MQCWYRRMRGPWVLRKPQFKIDASSRYNFIGKRWFFISVQNDPEYLFKKRAYLGMWDSVLMCAVCRSKQWNVGGLSHDSTKMLALWWNCLFWLSPVRCKQTIQQRRVQSRHNGCESAYSPLHFYFGFPKFEFRNCCFLFETANDAKRQAAKIFN